MNNISEMLDGYIQVPNSLWDYLPARSHIRFFVIGDQPATERFRIGGFIKDHFESDGTKALRISSGEKNFVIKYDTVESLWKKINYDSFIEIYMTVASLAEKQYQIKQILLQQKAMMGEIKALKEEIAKRNLN